MTFGGFHDGSWTLRGNAKPLADDLKILRGDPRAYRTYANEVFETDVQLAAIAHVLAGNKLDGALVAQIGEQRTLAELRADIAEIGYGS